MILNADECKKLWKKRKRDKSVPLPTEQYEVRYRYQKPDGFWTASTATYHGFTKADHDAVTSRWREEHPAGDLISVVYL